MSDSTPFRADDGVEKHPECIDRWGECPHWVVRRDDQVLKARIRGISCFEFMHREAGPGEYLAAIVAADAMLGNRPRRSVQELVDEEIEHLDLEWPTVDAVREQIEAEVERDEVRQPVLGLFNQLLDVLEAVGVGVDG